MHLRSKTVQQLLSVILSVVMILSMLPMEVLAQETPPVTTPMDLTAITEDTSGDGWSWTQSTKTPNYFQMFSGGSLRFQFASLPTA